MNENIKCDKLFKRIDELEKDYIDFLVDICNIESPTEYKEGVEGEGAHKLTENAEVSSLARCAKKLSAIAYCI